LEGSIVRNKLINPLSFTIALVLAFSAVAAAQTRRPAPPASTVTSYVPATDALVVVDVKRALNVTMPSIFGNDAAKLAQANAEIDKFKTKTGIDLRTVDLMTIGVQYSYPSAHVTKLDAVAIARGSFSPAAVTAAVRKAGANGQARDQKYRGATITVVNVNDDLKMLGVWNMHLSEIAVSVLDQNTIAFGDPARVRAAIDAGKAGRAPADLVALATHDLNAVAGFGANITRELLASLDVGSDTVAKDVSAIKQAYGSVGSADGNVALTLVARTDSEAAAKNLKDTVDGLRQVGGFFVAGMTEPRKSLAESALSNLKVTTRGNEVEIRTQVTAASLATLVK
jgi:alkylhydroperoxidase/carboxymuconolactone decarboxylase family protein YurZ